MYRSEVTQVSSISKTPVEDALTVVDSGNLEAASIQTLKKRVPLHDRVFACFEKAVNASPIGKYFERRRQRRLAQLKAVEAKSAALLAESANLSIAEALLKFDSIPTGLTDIQVKERLSQHGANVLSASKPPRWWTILLKCLPNPFNVLLLVLAIISIATQQTATFVILIIMVMLSVGLRFWQELKNNVAMNELILLVHDNVNVIRDNGIVSEIPKADLVPGDIVKLSGGDIIPADLVLIDTAGIYISQSTLTGETSPVLKQLVSATVSPESILECPNICFAGTTVTSGSATALVIATGDITYIGSLSQSINQKQESNEFERGVKHVSYMLISFMLVMVPIVLIISGLVSKDWNSAALFCISVAVGITPEMLPMIINANLCHAALKLAKHKVIVKRLDSVQTMGAIDVLCSDKTGTLTKDDITLENTIDCENQKSQRTLEFAYLNAFFQEGLRNAIDAAILTHGNVQMSDEQRDTLVREHQKIAELPFDFERRLLSVVVGDSEKMGRMITKGAPEETLRKCTHLNKSGEQTVLGIQQHHELEALHTLLNEQGMRVVAVASKPISLDREKEIGLEDENGLTFEGFLTFLDPPKEDAAQAITDLRSYGVAVKILTGDNVAAAQTVACKIGLLEGVADEHIISGPELAELDETAFNAKAESCIVFAKLKPLQKQEIVRALIRNGHSVGFLGDGINDAAALRSADVGISVDTGTSIAKHAANIILLQKSLAHVVNGVIYGRITHANTMKYIKMAASSNFGNIFSVTVAAAWLPFVPMAPLQLLLQNLLYDISQAAIPWDHVDKEMIAMPRKWKVWSIVRFMIWLGPTSSVFDICTFLIGWYYYGIRTTDNTTQVQLFQSQWFTEGLLTQLLVVVCLRTQHIPFIQSWPSRVLGSALTIIGAIGLALPYIPPIAHALEMQRPHPVFYGFLVAILLSYVLLVQFVKFIYKKIYKEWV